MKRARRTILGVVFTLGMILVMMPAMVAMADNTDNPMKEEIKKNSTVYAGEIFVDGVSKIQYVYSTDITLTKVVFNNLKDALKDTIFSDLIPGITNETTAVNGFFRYKNNSQETIQTKYKAEQNYYGGIDEDWSSAKTVASKSYTGTVNTETEKNLYDCNSIFKSNVDSINAKRKDIDNPVDADKMVVSHLSTRVETTHSDGTHNTVTYSCEVTTVIYTSVNVTSQKSSSEKTHTHSYDTKWSSSDTTHWHACTAEGKCDAPKKDEAAHSYGTSGDARFTCTVCGYENPTKKSEAAAADKAVADKTTPTDKTPSDKTSTGKTSTDTSAADKAAADKAAADKAAADKAAADKAAADKAARDAAAQASQAPASEPVTIMKAPAGVKAKGKKGKAIVSWKKIRKNKAGKKLLAQIRYTEVQYATDPAFTQNVGTRNVGKNKTKATLKLPRKTTYYVRVRYVGSDGVSNWSAVKKVTTK